MNQLVAMRIKSNRAPKRYQQLRLVIWHGLTYRLHTLNSRIKTIKSNLEVCSTPLVSHTINNGVLACNQSTTSYQYPGRDPENYWPSGCHSRRRYASPM